MAIIYYKNIKGKNYDGKMIRMAESLAKGKGDGRISLKDAKLILGLVKDSDDYTDIEKKTTKYIRDNYTFTPEADRWFRTEIRKWAAVKSSHKKARGKPAKKAIKKVKASKTKKKKTAPQTRPFEEDYQREDTIVLQQAGMADALVTTGKKKKIFWPVLIAIVALAAIIFGLSQCPEFNQWMKNHVWSGDTSKTVKPDATKEEIIPFKEKETQKATAPEKQQAPVPQEVDAHHYTVQVKDDLVSISEKVLKDYSRWKELYEINKDIIKNPYIIYPGQKLKIPGDIPKQ